MTGAARAALRARQGKGARQDSAAAPAADLLQARRATAYFARKLAELDDRALFAALPDGRSRAHVVAGVGYHARRLALSLEPLCPADPHLPPETFLDDLPSLGLAATLPGPALRHLFHHAAIHLDVCWRDLPAVAWDRHLAGLGNVRETPLLRAAALWQGAVALQGGGPVPAGLGLPSGG